MTSNTPDHGGRDDHPRDQLSSLREAKRVHIQLVLEKVAWNKKQAAKILEISRGTLYRKIAEYHYGASQPGPTAAAEPAAGVDGKGYDVCRRW